MKEGANKMQENERFWTVNEVAAMLRVNSQTIRRYLQAGKLTGVKLQGGIWRISDADLQKFIESRKNIKK